MKVIILAGGTGSRLWPLSTKEHPKQFIKFQDNKPSLFQDTFNRSLLLTSINDIFIVTIKEYGSLVKKDIEEIGYDFNVSNIIIEPKAKNTLPAIYAGVFEVYKRGNDNVVIFPSDHLIKNTQSFVSTIKASENLTKDSIITFGIKPTSPNTEYGYIAYSENKQNSHLDVKFKEKPDLLTAKLYIEKGYLWNSGIYMFYSEFFINEVKKHAIEIYNAFDASDNINEAFSNIKNNVSIDHGIMEKTKNITVVELDAGWSDLGSFDSLYEAFDKDKIIM